MHKTTDKLLALLAQEKKAILTGAFDQIESLATQKKLLLQKMSTVTRRQDLQSALHAIAHNQQLLTSAISGVNAARERLAALREVRDGLHVYTPWGLQQHSQVAGKELSKKA